MAEFKIDTRTFRVQAPLATVALALQFRTMGLLGASVGDIPKVMQAIATASDAGASQDRKVEANGVVLSALMGLLGRMKPEEAVSFLSDVVQMAEVKGANGAYERVDLDTEFSTDPSGLYALVGHVLRVVIGPFMRGLAGNTSPGSRAAG